MTRKMADFIMVSLKVYQNQTFVRLIAGKGILVRIEARSIHNFIAMIRLLLVCVG